jgi:spermidine/putrescine-binding protein
MKKYVIGMAAAVLVLSLVLSVTAFAQDREGGDRRKGNWGGGMDRAQMWNRMRKDMSPVTIATTDRYLFVVKGNWIYQYDVNTLKLKNRVEIEPEEKEAGEKPAKPDGVF